MRKQLPRVQNFFRDSENQRPNDSETQRLRDSEAQRLKRLGTLNRPSFSSSLNILSRRSVDSTQQAACRMPKLDTYFKQGVWGTTRGGNGPFLVRRKFLKEVNVGAVPTKAVALAKLSVMCMACLCG